MYLDSILVPVAQHSTALAGAIAAVMLCVGVKAMRTALQGTAAETGNGLPAQFEEIESTLERLRARISDMNPPGPAGLDQAKRTVALSMLQRGDSPAAIAAALSVRRSDIELLLKVCRIQERQAS